MNNKPFDREGLLKHNMMVLELVKTPLNIWGTGEVVCHPIEDKTDDRNALVEHFIGSGGIDIVYQQEKLKGE